MEGFCRPTPVGVIRKSPWILLQFLEPKGSANRLEFDDLQNDIGERVNQAVENPDKVRDLLRGLGQWRETVGAAVSEEPNPLYNAQAEPDGFDWL